VISRASSQNQAFNAILFFYRDVLGQQLGNINALRTTRPAHERHAPTVAETQLLLQTVRNHGGYPTNLIARMLYGCGLRVSEPLNLRTWVLRRGKADQWGRIGRAGQWICGLPDLWIDRVRCFAARVWW
jgi:integrase